MPAPAAGGRSAQHLPAGEDVGSWLSLRVGGAPRRAAAGRGGAVRGMSAPSPMTTLTTSLVTGGAGFLGSHLCERLLAEGHRVICVDNLVTGNRANLQALTIDEPIDNVLHFASPASPIDYLELPIQTLNVGSRGTHNTLGLAKAKRATYLLASTSEVYGDPLVHPQPETY